MSIKIYHICNGVNEGMKEEYHGVYKKNQIYTLQ